MAVCSERRRLMKDFSDGLQNYADLVKQSLTLLERGREAELLAVRQTGRLAWATVEEARLAVYRHEAEHGCDGRRAGPGTALKESGLPEAIKGRG